ncbi:HisA/HisF-related TIM barrel protein, partial [Elusimicrobiota bacterium]
YDTELLKKISACVTIPIIASGGAGKIEDFADAVKIGGVSAVAAGSMFVYQGKNRGVLINYPSIEELQAVLF